MSKDILFSIVKPRKTVEIILPDSKTIRGPRNAPVNDFLQILQTPDLPLIVGAIVNGELRELTFPIKMDSRVQPITMADTDGMRIYRRSLTMLLELAFHQLYPQAYLTVDHSVYSGGYYCQVSRRPPLSEDELKHLEGRMRQIVNENLPITRSEIPIEEAKSYFASIGAEDMVNLLAYRQKPYVTLYEISGFRDYHHGYMVPSTGYLKWFGLTPTNHGFTLQFPRRHAPNQLLPLPNYPKLLEAFRQYGDWLDRLGIANVAALNESIQAKRTTEVILVSEALHEQHVSNIASMILSRREKVRVILIAGPSSSGKTTFSKRLSVQLLARGLPPFPLEMDNYFVDRDKTPLDENGHYDFESINALNWGRLEQDLTKLISGQEVQIPKYDFKNGRSVPGDTIQLSENHIIILEGIHGLNPKIFQSIAEGCIFRIYVSALTQLNLDRHNRISTTDTRLIRRIVRDSRERGYGALQTIQHWESVRRGEKRYIFPYQNNADIMFNSALVYELSALKPLVEPLLRQVPFGTPEYIEAKRLLAFLEWFLPIESDLVPDNSILREFMGNSILQDFKLWTNRQNV